MTWDGNKDPANPHNWTKHKKWLSTILVSCFTFISPVSSTMLAPALPDLADEFDIESDFETYLIMSIFLLAYAIGPFLLAPLSEMYGRVVVLQSANMIYLIFNTVCGFSQTKNQILVFRFLSGLGGSAPQAVSLTRRFDVDSTNTWHDSLEEVSSVIVGEPKNEELQQPSTVLLHSLDLLWDP